MDRVFLVKPQPLIDAITETLKQNNKIVLPKNYDIIKMGCGKSNCPADMSWFYNRMAAIVRQIMLKGRVSLKGLDYRFGRRKNRGVRPSRFTKSSSFVNCSALEQLEKIGWVDFKLGENILTGSAKEVLGEIIDKVSE